MRALLLAMESTSARKLLMPHACRWTEMRKPSPEQSTEKMSGAGSIW